MTESEHPAEGPAMHIDTALDYYRRTEQGECPSKRHLALVNRETGEIAPIYCERLRACNVCLRREAFRRARAIGLAAPEHAITLTATGDSWREIQGRIRGFRRRVRRKVPRWQDLFHVECNPSKPGTHVHMWQWGGRPSLALVRESATAAGMGPHVHVEPRAAPRGAPLGYGMKSILDSPVSEGLTPEIDDFLVLNGERLHHQTRDFWRDQYGNRLPDYKASARSTRLAVPGSFAVVRR
jgi:hypothetical protein